MIGATTSTPPAVSLGTPPWGLPTANIFCPDSKENAETAYGTGYSWTNILPDHTSLGNSYINGTTLPATCTRGNKFIKHTERYHCDEYTCNP